MRVSVARCLGGVVCGVLLGPLSVAVAEPAARVLLERMNEAARTLNYEGTFVYAQGQTLEAMRIVHRYGEDGEQQRLISLNGAPREVVVTNDQVTSVLPHKRISVQGADVKRPGFPVSLPQELESLEQHYRFKMLEQDRIAGRITQVIAIEPRDKLRYGYRLWLDKTSHMVLRTALVDENGHYIEQLMFTELNLQSRIDPDKLESKHLSSADTAPTGGGWRRAVSEAVTDSRWVLKDPPPGFRTVLHSRFTETHNRHPTEHIVLSDGLATVSVFLEELDGAEPLLDGPSRIGAMNAHGTVLDDHQVLVVGEVPRETVRQVSQTLSHAGAGDD